MKNITSFINESINNKNTKTTTVGNFLKIVTDNDWNRDRCSDWFDNGGFNSFKNENEMYDFLNANKREKINVVSNETSNDYEVSFELKGKKIKISFTEPFNDDDEENWMETINGKPITVAKFLKIASFNEWSLDFCSNWFDNGGDYVFDSNNEMYNFLNSNKNEKMIFKYKGRHDGSFEIKGKKINLSYLQPHKY